MEPSQDDNHFMRFQQVPCYRCVFFVFFFFFFFFFFGGGGFLLKCWRRYINLKEWLTLWPDDIINDVMNTFSYKCSHNILMPMHRKFNVDIFARLLVIMKDVISFINDYRGPTFRPLRDVIGDVIILQNIFYGIIWDDLFISEVKLELCLIFQNFQNGRHYELATNFFSGSDTESLIYQKDSH